MILSNQSVNGMYKCEWLHRQLETIPLFKYPFSLEDLPHNGIYFFYEKGETWGHDNKYLRIVRVGTHKGNNFRSRINDHFLFNESKMNFNEMKSAPKDRSIFRKNIGRALLNKKEDDYLDIWNICFTPRDNREQYGHSRDIQKEKEIETKITQILKANFSFRFLLIDSQMERMGRKGLESSLIGTVASCPICKPSSDWLGNYSPRKEIRDSGLWLVQHLNADSINENDRVTILNSIIKTKEYIGE